MNKLSLHRADAVPHDAAYWVIYQASMTSETCRTNRKELPCCDGGYSSDAHGHSGEEGHDVGAHPAIRLRRHAAPFSPLHSQHAHIQRHLNFRRHRKAHRGITEGCISASQICQRPPWTLASFMRVQKWNPATMPCPAEYAWLPLATREVLADCTRLMTAAST